MPLKEPSVNLFGGFLAILFLEKDQQSVQTSFKKSLDIV